MREWVPAQLKMRRAMKTKRLAFITYDGQWAAFPPPQAEMTYCFFG